MRKLLILSLALILSTSSCFAWGFWNKDKDKTKSNSTQSNIEIENSGSGYVGKLPDLTKGFATTEPQYTKPIFEKTKDFNSADEITPIPRDNPAFVNIILKSEKTSAYINDINELLPQLENLLLCIENNSDVQKFNAKAYFFNKSVEYLRDKYKGLPESSYISFKKLLELSSHTQSIANLRAEAEKYRPYLAYTGAGYLYNDNVIDQQLEYLKTEIEQTIVVLKEVE